jgi:hypothetical protein
MTASVIEFRPYTGLNLRHVERLVEKTTQSWRWGDVPDFDQIRADIDGDPHLHARLVDYERTGNNQTPYLEVWWFNAPHKGGGRLFFEAGLLPGLLAPTKRTRRPSGARGLRRG